MEERCFDKITPSPWGGSGCNFVGIQTENSPSSGVCCILLDAQASVKSCCEDGRSALHFATKHPTNVAKLVLGAGAEVNVQAKDGCTPLRDAVVENNQEIIALPISHQASLQAKDSEGRTALDLSVQYQNSAAMQLMEGAGAPSDFSPESHVKQSFQPREVRDIFEVFWILRNIMLPLVPRHVILKILDYSKYWHISRFKTTKLISIMEKDCKENLPYLRSDPIRGPVREIRIAIWSHYQGFSDYREHHGTFHHSWTWFEFGVEKPSGKIAMVEDRAAFNVHASDRLRCHQVLYRGARSRFIHNLGVGDKILIIPKAKSPDRRMLCGKRQLRSIPRASSKSSILS